jgi:hypothetical protein
MFILLFLQGLFTASPFAPALDWWLASSVQEINEGFLGDNTDDAVRQGLLEYQQKFRLGESFTELWKFFPAGFQKQAFVSYPA